MGANAFSRFSASTSSWRKGGEVAGDGALPADQHVVEIGARLARDHHAGGLAQPTADPVAHDGIADLAADGETDPDGRQGEVGGRWGDLQDEARHGAAPAGLDAQKIAAVRQPPEARRGQFAGPPRPRDACGPTCGGWQ